MRMTNIDLNIHDVASFQLWKVERGRSGREFWHKPHPIYRVADSGSESLTRNKHAGGGLLGRRLDPKRVNFGLIGEWLSLCRSTHPYCEEMDADCIPGLQVIDCLTGHIIPLPPKASNAKQETPYVTLSYIWGPTVACTAPMLRPTDDAGTSSFALPRQIPLVIMDAMRVAGRLGYRYLWVDRYCIPQEDGAAKHIQIMSMGRIYSRSSLTIVAAAGEGPEYGLPGVSLRSRIAQVGVQINDNVSLVLYEAPMDHIANSKWNTRGWTYQEGLMSRRKLVFTDLMVYFQCQKMHGDEVLSLPIPGRGEAYDHVRALSFNILPHWCRLRAAFPTTKFWNDPLMAWKNIAEYGPKQLGYDSDALNAISGVMELYVLAVGDLGFKLFCGLPILPIRLWKNDGTYRGRSHACSFRTLFEETNPYEGPKSEEINDDSLIGSLVYSLTWRHQWGVSFESNPACWEQARRSIFGSWTVAGWRTRKLKPHPISIFDASLRIGVQYSGEVLLDWEHDNAKILDLSRNGKIPLYLNITGTVMDMKMTWKEQPMNNGSNKWNLGWVHTTPFKWNRLLSESPRWLFEEEVSGGEGGNGFLFLIMGCNYVAIIGDAYMTFVGMILRPVTRISNGQPHEFHENLGTYSFELHEGDWSEMAGLTREMEVRLI